MRPKGESGIGWKGWTAGYRVGKLFKKLSTNILLDFNVTKCHGQFALWHILKILFKSICLCRGSNKWRPLVHMYSLPYILYVLTHTCMWCTHAFLLRGGPNMHHLNLFQYSLLKFYTLPVYKKYFRPSSQWLHRVRGPGGGGWWQLVT